MMPKISLFLTVSVLSASQWSSVVAFIAPISVQSTSRPTSCTLEYAKTQDAVQPASLPSSHDGIYPATATATTTATGTTVTPEKKKQKPSSKSDIAWQERYNELKEFYNTHGHTNVPSSHTNKRLNRWVTNQRSLRKQGKKSMTMDRIRALDTIGFSWEGRMTWDKRYEQLKTFHETYGHSRVPINWNDNIELGRFVAAQRHQYKLREAEAPGGGNKKKSTLTKERFQKLQRLDFVFDVSDVASKAWDERYNELQSFFDENGHSNVSVKHEHDLWRWCDSQRIAYRQMIQGNKSSMTKEKIQKLNKIRFVWNPRETQWLGRLNELKEFRSEHGHVDVNENINPQLASWLKKQRNSSSLDEGKRSALMALGVRIKMVDERTEDRLMAEIDTKIYTDAKPKKVSTSSPLARDEARAHETKMKTISVQYALIISKYHREVARSRVNKMTTEENATRLMHAYANRSLWGHP